MEIDHHKLKLEGLSVVFNFSENTCNVSSLVLIAIKESMDVLVTLVLSKLYFFDILSRMFSWAKVELKANNRQMQNLMELCFSFLLFSSRKKYIIQN